MRTTVTKRKVAVITGSGAGVEHAAADEFARHGHDAWTPGLTLDYARALSMVTDPRPYAWHTARAIRY